MLKLAALLACPATVTVTLVVVRAPLGTDITILVSLQLVTVATALPDPRGPLKVTTLDPWDGPKLVPVIVTVEFTAPEAGDRLVIAGVTVKDTPLLPLPPTVTTTLPVVAPLGTGAAMLVSLQLVGVAVMPLKVIVLLPWLLPKAEPETVTEVPIGPAAGERLEILGVCAWATAIATKAKTSPETHLREFPIEPFGYFVG
jgi:hypothetical protein